MLAIGKDTTDYDYWSDTKTWKKDIFFYLSEIHYYSQIEKNCQFSTELRSENSDEKVPLLSFSFKRKKIPDNELRFF